MAALGSHLSRRVATSRQYLPLVQAGMSVQIRRPPPGPRVPGLWDNTLKSPLSAVSEPYVASQAVFGAGAVLEREVAQTFEHFTRVGLLLDAQAPVIAVGGHRGMGQNFVLAGTDQCTSNNYRENTLASFREAAAAGASFVEFDVQVTRDDVPVVWHDDCIIVRSEEGVLSRRKICEVSLAEFKALSAGGQFGGLVRESHSGAEAQLVAWRCTQDDELPTLAEVFQGVPEGVGFDIEVKMATSVDVAQTPPEEVERMASPILAEVQRWATKGRRMAFSSFDADVCAELWRRQSSIPVLFLSDGGEEPHADPRRTSLAAAVTFAAQHDLHGLVLDTSAVSRDRSIVALARSKGLQVLTYGVQNDDPAWVRQQQFLGVQAAIVDNVAGIAPAVARGINGFHI